MRAAAFAALVLLVFPSAAWGWFVPQGDSSLVAHRVIVASSGARVHLHWQIVADGPGGYCLVVPVPGEVIQARLGSPEVMARLDGYTAPAQVDAPWASPGCDPYGGDDQGTDPEVRPDVLDAVPDPRQAELSTHPSPAALVTWITARGCQAPPALEERLEGLAARGWSMVAAHVPPASPPRPEPGETPWAGPVVTILTTSPAVAPPMDDTGDLYLFTLGEEALVPEDRPVVVPTLPGYFSGEAFSDLYRRTMERTIEEGPDHALVLEFSGPVSRGQVEALRAAGLPAGGVLRRYHEPLPDDGREITFVVGGGDPPMRLRTVTSAGSMASGPSPPGDWLLVLLAVMALALGSRDGRRLARVVPLLAMLSGCLPVGELRDARLVPPGESRTVAALVPARDPRHDLDREPPVPQRSTNPRGAVPAVGVAYGLARGWDSQVMVFPVGGRLDLRRGLHTDGPVLVSAGVSVSGFWEPGTDDQCLASEAGGGRGTDGCFSQTRWGFLANVPLVVSFESESRTRGYVGLALALARTFEDLEYQDPTGTFDGLVLDKQSTVWTAGIFGGTVIEVGPGTCLALELQLISSTNEASKLVYYLVPGIGVRSTWPFE